MISNNCVFFCKNKVVIFLVICVFNAINAKYTVIDPSYNLLVSENEIDYIDTKAREDKFLQQIHDQRNETEETKVQETCTNYDYDNLVNEYYNEDELLKSDSTNDESNYAAAKIADEETMSWNSIREIWSLRKILIKRRLWQIIKVWVVIYLVVALPFWCTRGWCCCCLFCKFFKPMRTIDEAKRFLEANPPSVLQDKKGGVIFYEPTRKERECYEKFEHLIRTI